MPATGRCRAAADDTASHVGAALPASPSPGVEAACTAPQGLLLMVGARIATVMGLPPGCLQKPDAISNGGRWVEAVQA